MKRTIFLFAAFVLLLPGMSRAVSYIQAPPLKEVIRAEVGKVKTAKYTKVPLITWGGDIATILANGNSATTASGSILAQKGLNLKLVRMDDFKNQVETYLRGDMPYLRGTMGMINMASEVIFDPRTKPIVIYQMTWSTGGDCLVVESGIKTVKDLKGKTIAIQAYGPHVDYLAKALKDAGLSMSDIQIKWVKDLTGTDQTPAEAFYEKDVHAAFVIIPDGLMLTSGGSVGTGAEGSVKGARILMSTKTASRIIADVYAVRADYFEPHKDEIQSFVHGLLLAEQQLKELFRNKQSRVGEFKKMITAAADILLDSPQATGDAEALYGDCQYVGFRGNVKFFGDENWPRHFSRLTGEIQSAFVTIGLLGTKTPLDHAKWDYNQLRAGLTGIDDVEAPRFKAEEVAKVVAKKQAMGTLEEGELFSFEIFFEPNQKTFPIERYAGEFERVVEMASTYGGAVIIVEGHSDPMGYLRKKKKGASKFVLTRTKQAAKNLSLARAIMVRDSVMVHAKDKALSFDPSQFSVIGHGIMEPTTGMCGGDPCPPKTEEQWRSNMRVAFRIIQVEAEASVFTPLD